MKSTITTAALTVAALAASAAPAYAAVPGAMRPHVQSCPMTQLQPALSAHRGSMGADRWTLTLTNEGGTCTAAGYPRLRLRTPAGKLAYPVTVRGPVLGVPDNGPETITLTKGQNVTAAVGYGDDGATGATSAAELDVRVKGAVRWAPVTFPGGPVNVYLDAVNVTAWTKGK